MIGYTIKAARALLGWSLDNLAAKSGVSSETIATVESSQSDVGDGADRIVAALKAAGIEFLLENGEGIGVRLKKTKPGPIDGEDLNASNDE
jgi:transcriptional regulator with XRE-family HTH domain